MDLKAVGILDQFAQSIEALLTLSISWLLGTGVPKFGLKISKPPLWEQNTTDPTLQTAAGPQREMGCSSW
jgi:hypothetical protein